MANYQLSIVNYQLTVIDFDRFLSEGYKGDSRRRQLIGLIAPQGYVGLDEDEL